MCGWAHHHHHHHVAEINQLTNLWLRKLKPRELIWLDRAYRACPQQRQCGIPSGLLFVYILKGLIIAEGPMWTHPLELLSTSILLSELQWWDYLRNFWAFSIFAYLLVLSTEPARRKDHWAGIHLWLSENFWKEAILQLTFAEHTVPGQFRLLLLRAPVLRLSAVPLAPVLDVIDYPTLSTGPGSDLRHAFVRNQLGKKNKNCKAPSSWPEIRGLRVLFHYPDKTIQTIKNP